MLIQVDQWVDLSGLSGLVRWFNWTKGSKWINELVCSGHLGVVHSRQVGVVDNVQG